MTGEKAFNEYLNLPLKLIKNNRFPFGEMSVMAVDDLLQFLLSWIEVYTSDLKM